MNSSPITSGSENKNMTRQKGFNHTEETKEKIRKKNYGTKSSQWKGDDIGYMAVHAWLWSRYGKADRCESKDCNGKSKRYEWALKKGKECKRRRSHFIRLCRSCHHKYDMNESWKKKIAKTLTQYTVCSVPGCGRKHLSKSYCSYHYNTIYRKKLC